MEFQRVFTIAAVMTFEILVVKVITVEIFSPPGNVVSTGKENSEMEKCIVIIFVFSHCQCSFPNEASVRIHFQVFLSVLRHFEKYIELMCVSSFGAGMLKCYI